MFDARAWLGQATGARRIERGPVNDSGYSGTQAAKIVGITYRQLDYWARTDLIRPSLDRRHGEREPAALLATTTCSSCA